MVDVAPPGPRSGRPIPTTPVLTFTTLTTPVGRALVARSPQGLAELRLGPDDAALVEGLRVDRPGTHLERDDLALAELAGMVEGFFAGDDRLGRVDLDVRATPFQVLVYRELRRIPRGCTRSYAEVARAVGRPTAWRAVASACAANPVCLAVPCHRVVRSDGSLAGYRWGMQAKAALLAAEGAVPDC